jgi:hypothetical protein
MKYKELVIRGYISGKLAKQLSLYRYVQNGSGPRIQWLKAVRA